jgi:branched-chain amino acid aminotransferase
VTIPIRIDGHADADKARQALSGPLTFGQIIADLMLTIRHDADRGWHDAAIVPLAPLELSPAAKVLHYGNEIFEGHKAYAWPDGAVMLFRPEQNARRLNVSARRMRLPEIPEELQLRAIELLVDQLRVWVPRNPQASLYLRPTMIGIDPYLGVSPSRSHLYFVIASPVGSYFPQGFASVSVFVEEQQTRAAPGGTGACKAGGNYATGFDAQQRAHEAGFDQVLWLDAHEHLFVEELNAMNVFVVENGELLTPRLGGTILAGITRQSILEMASDYGLQASERSLMINDVVRGIEDERITEMFAVGTAAVISPIGMLGYQGKCIPVGDGQPGPVSRKLYTALTDIQYGLVPDTHGWMRVVRPGTQYKPKGD